MTEAELDWSRELMQELGIAAGAKLSTRHVREALHRAEARGWAKAVAALRDSEAFFRWTGTIPGRVGTIIRSEERRVGKEC